MITDKNIQSHAGSTVNLTPPNYYLQPSFLLFFRNDNEEPRTEEEFEWVSRWQHVLYALAYTSDFSGLFHIFAESRAENLAYILPFLVLSIAIGYPIVLFQTTAGQYTRNGYLIVGEMLPVFYGLGFSMIILGLIDLFTQYFYFRGVFHYLISCLFNKSLPWMECFSGYYAHYPGCVSFKDLEECLFREDKTKPCFPTGTKTLSAEIYRKLIVFTQMRDYNSWFIPGKFMMRLYILLGIITAILVTSAINKNYKTLYPALRIGYSFSFLFIFSCSFLMMTQRGFLLGIQNLMEELLNSKIFAIKPWKVMLVKVVLSLKVANGGYFTFGAFIPKAKPDKYRTAILIFAYVVAFYGSVVYFHVTSGPLMSLLGMEIKDIMKEDDIEYMLALFPTVFGLVPCPNFFSFLYFFVFFIISYFGIVVKVFVIETAISLYFRISPYSSYIRFTICILTSFFGFLFQFTNAGVHFFKFVILKEVLSILVVCLQLAALIFYGMENFEDDIEYIMTFRLKAITKLAWGCGVIICLVVVILEAKLVVFKKDLIFNSVCVSIITAPLMIGFLYQLCHSMKKKNLIGLLKPSERYGPPDLDERIRRILYNPRYIEKWKRRDACTHDCLLGCNAVMTAVQREIMLVQNMVDSFSTASQEQEYTVQFKTLEKQLDILLKISGLPKENQH